MKLWPAIQPAAEAVSAIDVTPPEVRMGEMLWSAIERGGLLDERWWAGWMHGVQHEIDLDKRALWVTMRPADASASLPRRWRADPVTRLLILAWHREGLTLMSGIVPRDCLALFRGGCLDEPNRLLARARRLWAIRLPGVMSAYAAGEIASTSLPRSRWRSAMALHQLTADVPPTSAPDGRSKEGPFTWARDLGLVGEWQALSKEAPYAAGAARARASKQAAAAAISQLGRPASSIQAALRGWSLYALKHERGRTSGQGYALRTTQGYLGLLSRTFATWKRGDPLTASAGVLHDHLAAHLNGLTDERRDKTIKAVLSFVRFYNSGNSAGPLAIDMELYSDEARVSPDVLLPAEYQRALTSLARHPHGTELSLILTLGYRAGLRLSEIMGLRVGDFIDAGGQLELVVESNHGRGLKTRTSRRILPLDVLLDADERAQLSDWLKFSRKVSEGVGETWMFGPIALRRPADATVKRDIEQAIRVASGVSSLRFEHLRHSFASYLLATLLLPFDAPDPVIPASLTDVVSPTRRTRLNDRLLGQQRLGAGAVHAVSQALGHTAPGTTLTYYCHLLDMVLGWYVDRASTLLPVDDQWLRTKLQVGADACRKAAVRHRAPREETSLPLDYRRPTARMMEDATLGIAANIAAARLLDSHCSRLTARLRREVDLRAEIAITEANEKKKADAKGRGDWPPKRIRPSRPRPRPEGVPWQVIVKALNTPAVADDGSVGAELLRRWHADAERLHAREMLGGEAADSFQSLAPAGPAYQLFVDARLAAAEIRTKAERAALLEAMRSVVKRGAIRLRRLGDARAFVPVLLRMGFRRSEIVLTGTSKSAAGLSSAELHDLLAAGPLPTGHRACHLTGRSGWRGSLIVRMRPEELEGPVLASRACRFALIMLAIDADLFR